MTAIANTRIWISAGAALLWLGLLVPLASAAEALSARAAVAANSVFVGEAFRFQVQVTGSESPEQPDVTGLSDFTVGLDGGVVNSSSSITIINGRRSESRREGYIFNYTLVAKRAGQLTIPPITVRAGGQIVTTQPVRIIAQQPVEAENFKLRLLLSKEQAYVGEPLVAELVFYYSADVREPRLTPPPFGEDDFHISELKQQDAGQTDKVEQLDGKRFQTMRIRYALVPKRAGKFSIKPATLAFQGAVGTRTGRDFFNQPIRQAEYKRFVIPSNEASLDVLALPSAGRPDNFAGHVGEFEINVSASPTEVNVGDPITLNIAVAGPPFLDQVELPALQEQASLSKKFKIPKEREAGKVSGNYKLFTQTVRALDAGVTEIPPIELPYFDTASGSYKVASSKAIPLVVNATNVVTASDAEGLSPVLGQTSEIQAWTRGIAHNYEDIGALQHHRADPSAWLQSPVMLALVGAPPVTYAALFCLMFAARRRSANPEAARARRALGELSAQLGKAADSDAILEALRGFLGAKLRRPAGALTANDLEQPLLDRGADPQDVVEVRAIFTECEASRYAGTGGGGGSAELAARALAAARNLDKQIA